MSQHDLAFTVLTSQTTDDTVVLSTHREYRDATGTLWVETVNGRVKKSDIEKATGEGSLNQYGESQPNGSYTDEEREALREFVAAKRKEKLANNPAATARKATIMLPVEDAYGFQVGVWYQLRFERADGGKTLRSLIGTPVPETETVAVERSQQTERSAER